MIQTIFFDMDGTLVDTEKAAAVAVTESFSKWGVNVAPQDARFIVGRTWARAFDYLFSKYAVPVSRETAENELISAYRESMKQTLVEVPGAVSSVLSLAEHYPLGLISGSFREEILYILERLKIRDAFQVILGAEDYPKSKPAPDGYLKALDLLQAKADRTLVFEDSEAGIASGLAAGLKVCAITSTNHFSVDTSGAHVFIQDLKPVNPEWVRSLTFLS